MAIGRTYFWHNYIRHVPDGRLYGRPRAVVFKVVTGDQFYEKGSHMALGYGTLPPLDQTLPARRSDPTFLQVLTFFTFFFTDQAPSDGMVGGTVLALTA